MVFIHVSGLCDLVTNQSVRRYQLSGDGYSAWSKLFPCSGIRGSLNTAQAMGFSWTQVAAAAFSSYDFWFGINHKVMRFLWRSQLWKFNITCHVQRFVSTKSSDPLRILFCGSDNFSIESLRALNDERQKDAESIASIDVVCRPGKRIGRDLKTVREGKMQRTRIIYRMTERPQSTHIIYREGIVFASAPD